MWWGGKQNSKLHFMSRQGSEGGERGTSGRERMPISAKALGGLTKMSGRKDRFRKAEVSGEV